MTGTAVDVFSFHAFQHTGINNVALTLAPMGSSMIHSCDSFSPCSLTVTLFLKELPILPLFMAVNSSVLAGLGWGVAPPSSDQGDSQFHLQHSIVSSHFNL